MHSSPWRAGRTFIATAVIVGILSAGAINANGTGANTDPTMPLSTTVDVLAKRTLMSAPTTPSVGAGFVGADELFDPQNGSWVGDGYSHCAVMTVTLPVPPAVTAQCTSVFQLPDGQLHLSDLRTYASLVAGFEDMTMAVVGGTGAYAGARGDGTATKVHVPAATPGGTPEVRHRFTFTLTYGPAR
jgi:hypothetical protein